MSISIIVLGIVMKAPIWYLPAKVSSLSGGDGWHRSYLLEMAYKNLGKWWFAGMGIEQTRDWFPYNLEATGGADMTNTYLGFGITAGLLAMGLFITLLVVVFKTLGKALALVGESGRTNKETAFLLWGFGVMIAGHATNWLGIIYFDQTYVLWFMQLAIISSVTGQISRKKLPQQIAVTQAELVTV